MGVIFSFPSTTWLQGLLRRIPYRRAFQGLSHWRMGEPCRWSSCRLSVVFIGASFADIVIVAAFGKHYLNRVCNFCFALFASSHTVSFSEWDKGSIVSAKLQVPCVSIFYFLFSIFFSLSANAQCAMCRAALESSGNNAKVEAVNDGIVFLMAIPYIIVAGIGFVVYKMYYKKK